MVDVVVFHHVQGLTAGVHAFADELRREGHRVETPDLFGGRTFDTIADGLAFVGEIGRDVMVSTAVQAAERLARDFVYVGFSLGARPAQFLAQTTQGARGALLLHGYYPTATFGSDWPDGVGLQVHLMDDDKWCDLDVAEALLKQNPDAMRQRKRLVEHPYGTIKHWMGATHFLMKRLPNVQAEMSLHVLTYNLRRAINILGVPRILNQLQTA